MAVFWRVKVLKHLEKRSKENLCCNKSKYNYFRISFLSSNKFKTWILICSKHSILASYRVISILINFQQNISNFLRFLSTPRKQTVKAKLQSNGPSKPYKDLTFSSHNGSVNLGQSSIMPDQLKLGVGLKEV